MCIEPKSGVNQKVERKYWCKTKKIDSNSILWTQIELSLEIEMSLQIFGRRVALVEKVLTWAHAPQEHHKVCE